MRKERLAHFRKQLVEKQRQLTEEVGRTALYGKDQEDDSIKDLGNQANTAYTREFFFELGNGDRRLLRDVVSALQKLDDGAFGSCERCSEPISEHRLDRAVAGDRMAGRHLLRARPRRGGPRQCQRRARALQECRPRRSSLPPGGARAGRRLRADRRSPRSRARVGARRRGVSRAAAPRAARARVSARGPPESHDRALPGGGRAGAGRSRPRGGARPGLLRARDAGRGRGPAREGRGPHTRLARGPRAPRRRLRAAWTDPRGLRRVSPCPATRARVRLAASVRGMRRRRTDVAGPLRPGPALGHAAPPSRPAPPALPPGLSPAALDLRLPAPRSVCQASLGPGRRDPLCGRCWGAITRLGPPGCDACGLASPTRAPFDWSGATEHRWAGAASLTRPGLAYRGPAAATQVCLGDTLDRSKFTCN